MIVVVFLGFISTGGFIGVVVGVAVGACVLGGLIYYCCLRGTPTLSGLPSAPSRVIVQPIIVRPRVARVN